MLTFLYRNYAFDVHIHHNIFQQLSTLCYCILTFLTVYIFSLDLQINVVTFCQHTFKLFNDTN